MLGRWPQVLARARVNPGRGQRKTHTSKGSVAIGGLFMATANKVEEHSLEGAF